MPRLLPRDGPQRLLACSTLVNSTGSGDFLTAGVLYFTRTVGLPAGQVGLGLSAAGLASLAAGRLADAHGARGVYALTLLVRALATAGFVFATFFTGFVVTVGLAMSAQAAGLAARSPLIRQHGGPRPQEFRAYLRAVTNVGISLGALMAGCAAQLDVPAAYRLLIAGNALCFAVAAAMSMRLPPCAKTEAPVGVRPWCALRDGRYVALAALDGVMALQFKVLTVALPLWLALATSAPRWLVAATMVVNAAIVIAFQVPASRNITTPERGGRAYRRAGLAFLASSIMVSTVDGAPAWTASVGILCAAVVHTVGELWHSAANFEVSFALAPDHAAGQYLGVFGMGIGFADFAGPALLVFLCVTWGRPGWYVLGTVFVLAGLLAPPLVRRAETNRGPGRIGPGDLRAVPDHPSPE